MLITIAGTSVNPNTEIYKMRDDLWCVEHAGLVYEVSLDTLWLTRMGLSVSGFYTLCKPTGVTIGDLIY